MRGGWVERCSWRGSSRCTPLPHSFSPHPSQHEYLEEVVKERAVVKRERTNWAQAVMEMDQRFRAEARALSKTQWQAKVSHARRALKKEGTQAQSCGGRPIHSR